MSSSASDIGGTDGRMLPGVDEILNIFALANSVELLKDPEADRSRTLEWYRDGGPRRIHLELAEGASLDVDVAAERNAGGQSVEVRERFRSAVAVGELRPLLVEAVDVANALTLPDPPDP